MNILAIETSTEALSVAVMRGDEVFARHEIAPRRHAEWVLPWCEELLAAAQLSRSDIQLIAVGRGPGAFTGVRLGLAVAQGLSLALGVPAVAVSTLRILAAAIDAAPGTPLIAAIDARMNEVYWATFEATPDGPRATGIEQVCAPEHVHLEGTGWQGAGTGFAALDGALRTQLAAHIAHADAHALPQASVLARLALHEYQAGRASAPDTLEPAYLRNQVALTLEEQAAARAARRST